MGGGRGGQDETPNHSDQVAEQQESPNTHAAVSERGWHQVPLCTNHQPRQILEYPDRIPQLHLVREVSRPHLQALEEHLWEAQRNLLHYKEASGRDTGERHMPLLQKRKTMSPNHIITDCECITKKTSCSQGKNKNTYQIPNTYMTTTPRILAMNALRFTSVWKIFVAGWNFQRDLCVEQK